MLCVLRRGRPVSLVSVARLIIDDLTFVVGNAGGRGAPSCRVAFFSLPVMQRLSGVPKTNLEDLPVLVSTSPRQFSPP